MAGTKKFVFVVCGAKEHIETLHFSLRALKYFSKHEIWIVTDSSRNEIPLIHNNIIDVKCPDELTHHQASIYLKTGLHKFLPLGNLYCYLDSDVIALNSKINDVFDQKTGLITFAPDHSKMNGFSPYAINCDCLNENLAEWAEIDSLLEKYCRPTRINNTEQQKKQEKLLRNLELTKRSKLKLAGFAAKYITSGTTLHFADDLYYDKKQQIWFDAELKPVMIDITSDAIKKIEKISGWRWNMLRRRWISPSGNNIHQLHCSHLINAIHSKFQIQITNPTWQHWNGGVFLFDNGSHAFMESWHQKTMLIFSDPEWKTRDQGTLIATAWQFGLMHLPLLSKTFNFIADPSNQGLMVSDDREYITDDAFETKYAPAFIHIFNNFGHKGWEIWDWVEEKLVGTKQLNTAI